jgi:gas vesicle protein
MENSKGNTAIALLAGVAAGAALGLLLAPRSGKETREALLNKGEELQEDLGARIESARKEWNKAKGKLADAASMTKDEVSDFIHYMFKEGKSAAGRVAREASATAGQVADQAKRAGEDMKQTARSN